MTWLILAWKFIKGLWESLPGKAQAVLIGAVVLALAAWWVNDRAYNRGYAKGLERLAICQQDLSTLRANVKALQAGIDDRNKQIDAYAKAERDKAAAADRKAKDALAGLEASRAHEKSRGAGAEAMNGFMADISGALQ